MNTILQKRIEEAAKTSITETLMSTPNYEFSPKATDMLECAYIKGAEDILNNQWISVEEALPEVNKNTKLSDKCFIARKGKFGCPDWFGNGYYDKDMGWINHGNRISNITHWMPIPSLEGCEK